MLAFDNEAKEATGIADLIEHLIRDEGLEPSEILVLLRGDSNGTFSKPIKEQLDRRSVAYSDPDIVKRILGDAENRRLLEMLRLLVNRSDSLAWASLLHLTNGIGKAFFASIYDRAKADRSQFGIALLAAHGEGFPATGGRAKNLATTVISATLTWLEANDMATGFRPESGGWGQWIIDLSEDEFVPAPSEELADLLLKLDKIIEPETVLGGYLNQINPLGKDINQSETQGVRIMSMGGSKGLTVKAAIIAATEEGIVPRPEANLGEERRLLYVALTRARQFTYVTWARRRKGPTARSGAPNVGTLRYHSTFLNEGPVQSQPGSTYLAQRWPAPAHEQRRSSASS